VLATAAAAAGVIGVIIDGGVRDSIELAHGAFPVFSTRLCIRGTTKLPDAPGSIGASIEIGGVRVTAADPVFGDADGVVVVPDERLEATLAAAAARESDERSILKRLGLGERTLDIYGLGGAVQAQREEHQ
jgi:4-hydroxy-4-methyl-2-oxoglutarate aldolase